MSEELGYIVAQTGFSRVFLIEGRARPDHAPTYESCLMAGSPSVSFGDVERIECPDPDRYNDYIEVGRILGAIERGAVPLTGRYAADLASTLLRIAKARCAADVQVHIGQCQDPRVFNDFEKAVILEDAQLTNWSATDLGALGSDQSAVVDESSDISFGEIFEALQLTFSKKGETTVTNPVVDVVICDKASCGDCDDESDGCEHVYAVSQASPGSPGTAPDLLYSTDKAQTWSADNINSLTPSEEPNALACLGDYVVVVSEDSESHHYKLRATIDAGTALGWTEVTGGYVAGNGPMDIWSVGNYAFIAAENGYVYGLSDPTGSVTVLDAGVATTNLLKAVHALSDHFAVCVGASDTIIYTTDGENWQAATATGGGNNLLSVWCKTTKHWIVGDDGGNVYWTLDGGVTWTAQGAGGSVALPGADWTDINDISFASKSVGYLSAEKDGTPRGYMLRTFDGGHSWVVLPEGVGSLPLQDAIYAHAACSEDINFVVGVGLADNATDGVIVVGQD